jgi:hypothetical protein
MAGTIGEAFDAIADNLDQLVQQQTTVAQAVASSSTDQTVTIRGSTVPNAAVNNSDFKGTVLDVQMFGAVPDGVVSGGVATGTDNTAAFQLAINTAQADGHELHVIAGAYLIASNVTIPGGSRIVFRPGAKIILPYINSGAANQRPTLFTPTGDDIVIDGLWVDGSGSPVTANLKDWRVINGIRSYLRLRRARMNSVVGYGVYLNGVGPNVSTVSWSGGVATFTLASSCPWQVNDYVVITNVSPAGYNGTYQVQSVSGSQFTVNLATNPGAYVSGGYTSIVIRGTQFRECEFYFHGCQNGIGANQCIQMQGAAYQTQIHDSYFENCAFPFSVYGWDNGTANAIAQGLNATGLTMVGCVNETGSNGTCMPFETQGCDGVTINGVTITKGIYATAGTRGLSIGSARNSSVSNCTIEDQTLEGIEGGGGTNTSYTNLNLIRCARGMTFAGKCSQISVVGGRIVDSDQYGIFGSLDGGTPGDGILIDGVSFENCQIRISGWNDVKVKNCRFRYDASPFPYFNRVYGGSGFNTSAVSNITNANPGVVTVGSVTGLNNNDTVIVSGVVGAMSGFFPLICQVGSVNSGANTFTLAGINTNAWGAYASGGTVTKISDQSRTDGFNNGISLQFGAFGATQETNVKLLGNSITYDVHFPASTLGPITLGNIARCLVEENEAECSLSVNGLNPFLISTSDSGTYGTLFRIKNNHARNWTTGIDVSNNSAATIEVGGNDIVNCATQVKLNTAKPNQGGVLSESNTYGLEEFDGTDKFIAAAVGTRSVFNLGQQSAFTPASVGWYRIVTGTNYVGGLVNIKGQVLTNVGGIDRIADLTFYFGQPGFGQTGDLTVLNLADFGTKADIFDMIRMSNNGGSQCYVDLHLNEIPAGGSVTVVKVYLWGPNGVGGLVQSPALNPAVGSSSPQTFAFARRQVKITAMTNANPAQFTTQTSHQFNNGDSVYIPDLPGVSSGGVLPSFQTVTVVDGTHFTIPQDSTAWGAFGTSPTQYAIGKEATGNAPRLESHGIMFIDRAQDPNMEGTLYWQNGHLKVIQNGAAVQIV